MIPLKYLASGSPVLLDQCPPSIKEMDEDPSSQDLLRAICAIPIILAFGVTFALILHLYLGHTLVPETGVLVSDHEHCTALGQKVLRDCGNSVDAAIAAALCLGIVHPHVSGIGGGGVMLVHDIHENETMVINFQGIAPKALTEEMLQNVLELKAGLQVGVPGMLRGLHHAHYLYGSLLWEDVVTRAAAVAREGFNVSVSLAEAISKVKGEQLSQHFRDVFLPGGRALQPGDFLKTPGLAEVLEAGLSKFYDGNLSQEIVDEVRVNGGVLSREDIRNYSIEVERPVEGLYNEFLIQVPPPPSAGAALLSAVNILESFHLNENNYTENQTHHWITEALKAALAMASGLGDSKYNSSVTEQLSDMLSKSHADGLRQRINYSYPSPPEGSSVHSLQAELPAGQVVVMGPDDLVVSVASSLSRPFGSRLMTPSGVILNSLILLFSLPNATRGQLQTNQGEMAQPGKRPLSSLMPTVVVPAWHPCGLHMALSSKGGQRSFSAVTQVLSSGLSHQNECGGFSLEEVHPQILVDPEFLEESVQFWNESGHVFQRMKTHSVVLGILRKNNSIQAIAIPLSDGPL
uniref:gamma-glutamyltransferase 7-like isoform X2 n=1 Tax=Monopterus albus TaxID=43700 RepID=UPI0009B3D473|nr:gamma-glutamyltransferase 7-like isoform X2 [Monopterus albus]